MLDDYKRISLFMEKRETFLESESYALISSLKENRLLISVLKNNFTEFTKMVTLHNSSHLESKIFANPNSKFRYKIQLQIMRLLSNYLNSLYAFIEYSRKNVETFIKSNKKQSERMMNEKDTFLKNDLHYFIIDLRNYCTHNSFLKVGSTYSFNINWETSKKDIYIRKTDLLKGENLHSNSTKLIDRYEENIYIVDLLKNHYSEFIKLQDNNYKRLLLVDLEKTDQMIKDVEFVISLSTYANISGTLPFSNSYVKYLYYLRRKIV